MDSEKKQTKINDYVLSKTLGSGYNSVVKLGKNLIDGQYYAIKIIRDTSHVDSNIKAILNETKVLKTLDHPNIIKLKEVTDEGKYTRPDGTSKNVMFAAIQLAQNGEIFEYLANTGRFSEKVARFYFKQLISALDYLHSKGYAHRDLKPENVLLDDKFNLLLADFGFATRLSGKDGSGKLRSILGTESYMAPEIHSKSPYIGTSVDLFAAGIILFIFITGHPPFNQAKTNDRYYQLICMNNHEKFWQYHSRKKPNGEEFFSEDFKNLINSLLAYDPTHRLSMAEIKAHKWYNSPTATKEEILEEFSQRKDKVEKMLARQREIAEKKRRIAEMKRKQNQGEKDYVFEGVNPTFRGAHEENKGRLVGHGFEELEDLEFSREISAYHRTQRADEIVSFMTPKEFYIAIAIAARDAGVKDITFDKAQVIVSFFLNFRYQEFIRLVKIILTLAYI